MLTINQISNHTYNRIQPKNNKKTQNLLNTPAFFNTANSIQNNISFQSAYMPLGVHNVAKLKAQTSKLSFIVDGISKNASSVAQDNANVFLIHFLNNLVRPYAKRKDSLLSAEDVDVIAAHTTPKNIPLLSRILSFKDNLFETEHIADLLQYINQEETSVEELNEKMDNLENLKQITKGMGFKKSVLPEFFDEIPASSVVDLLKCDLLLNETKNNFNTLLESYNVVAKYFDHLLDKKEIKKDEKEKVEYQARKLIKDSFVDMLHLGMVFDKSACNELFYNRGLYVKPNYIPRLKILNNEDLKLLRKVQTSAVTEKENKGGDLSVYEISLDDKISMLDLLAANREIINAGYQGLNFLDYISPVDTENNHGNFKIHFQDLKRDLTYCVLKRIGVDPSVVDKYAEEYDNAITKEPDLRNYRDKIWDINYCHLLNAPEDSMLRKIITNETTSNFENWIFREGFINSNTKPIGENDPEGMDYVEELYKKGILDPQKDRFMPYIKDRINTVIGLYRKNLLDPNNRDQRMLFIDKSFDYIQTLHKLKMLSVINEINRRDFEKNGIDTQKWLKPETKPLSGKFKSRDGRREKTFTVKNWERKPMESLFDGNYTTCCTGIDKDQGASFLSYMTNTCSTTLEVRTEKNKVVAMSRILMTKIRGKLAMVIENIEVNNKIAKHYLYDDVSKYKFREMIFDYARNFAKEINKNQEDIPVYFCGRYVKVADIRKGLKEAEKETDIEILGTFENNFYVNSYGSQWDMLRIRDVGDEFFLHVGEVTEKTEPPKENVIDKDSDSNYNHGDLRDYK